MEITTRRGNFYIQDKRKEGDPRPPLLLIHGAGGMHLDWPPKIRRKMPMGVITVDLVGHGKTAGSGRESIEDYALDMFAVLNTLGVTQVIAVGHSMGGAIAQMMALAHPQKVAGLILIGTSAYFQVNEAIINGIVENTKATADMIMRWAWGKDVPEEWRRIGAERLTTIDPRITYYDYIACNNFDVRGKLQNVKQATLIIGGKQDKMAKKELSEELHRQLPNSQLNILDSGHMIQIEKTDEVFDLIVTWYEKQFHI